MGDSPLKITLPKRPRLSTDWKKCLICQRTSKEGLSSAKEKGTTAVIRAAKKRHDSRLDKLTDEEMKEHVVMYHRSCYQSYTSKKNLNHVGALFPLSTNSQEDKENSIPTRATMPFLTDWSKCIICHSRKRDSLHEIQSVSCQSSLTQAAEVRQDEVMLGRLIGVDLVAKGAIYHKACMATYTSKEHTSKAARTNQRTDSFQMAFTSLITEIDGQLKDGKAFTMKYLADEFRHFLPQSDEHSYRPERLQKCLENHYGNAITIQPQYGQGRSNIILSNKITVGDAIQALSRLKGETSSINLEQNSAQNDDIEERTLLHKAVGILRREIACIQTPTEYPCAEDMNLKQSEKLVPSLLSKTILWLLDSKSFESPDEGSQPSEVVWRRTLALSECLIYCSRRHLTPLHLGLAAQLHHLYGKRKLIDILHSHGFVIGYDELHRFLTAVGEHEIDRTQNDVYVPHGLVQRSSGGSLIQEGADNLDINCQTIDGKNTFHAMARVAFQQQQTSLMGSLSTPRIPLGRKKSLVVTPTRTGLINNILHYSKPNQRSEPLRLDDAVSLLQELERADKPCSGQLDDLAWLLMRAVPRINKVQQLVMKSSDAIPQRIPFWTGFNASISDYHANRMVSAYCPIIDAKPSDPSTVYTTMVRCKKMTNQLGQPTSVQTLDLQLYAVAQQVKWATNTRDGSLQHVLRLGGFHSLCTYIAAVGKLWGDAGLSCLLADIGVYAACSVDQMLDGKQFHRAVRGLTLAYEALMHMFLTEFMAWCEFEDMALHPAVWTQLRVALNENDVGSFELSRRQAAVSKLKTAVGLHLNPLLDEFKKQGCAQSPTFHYWVMFLDAVQILLNNIRAEREGNWPLHLSTQAAMVPYFFAADRVNYARWMPVYLLDMTALPTEVETAFQSGEFKVCRSPGFFNGVWSDMGTETTIIRDAKGEGGVIGLTRKVSALNRLLLTRHCLGEYAAAMEERSGNLGAITTNKHEQTLPAQMNRDEEDVVKLIDYLKDCMTNPFKIDDHPEGTLVNIATGMMATQEVQKSLLTAIEVGRKRAYSFVEGCLSTTGTRSLYSSIKRTNLKTFQELKKKTPITLQGKIKEVHIDTELVFRRALVITRLRPDITMKSVLSRPVTSVPTALFHEDGSMRKTAKSDLLHILEGKLLDAATTNKLQSPSASTVYIRDAMAELQSMRGHATFNHLAECYLNRLAECTQRASVVVDVFDQYCNRDSIKAEERVRRQRSTITAGKYQVAGNRAVPPWDKFMAVSDNKKALVTFLCNFLVDHLPTSQVLKSHQKSIYLAGGFKDGRVTRCITSEGAEDVVTLHSTHEEADTRMLLHACSADKNFCQSSVKGTIIIKSPDTDVLVLAIYYWPKMTSTEHLWLETGTSTGSVNRRRHIPVHEIARKLHPSIPHSLPAIHALTGCDSVSSFYGIGKRKVFKLLEALAEKDQLPPIHLLGTDSEDEAYTAARTITAFLYDTRTKHQNDLNTLRVQLASTKDVPLNRLPPSEASFKQHVQRASFQTRIWTSSHIAEPTLPCPVNNGWIREGCGEFLKPRMFEGQTAAEVLDGLLCTCRGRNQCSKNCSCSNLDLGCTEACLCGGTENCNNKKSETGDI